MQPEEFQEKFGVTDEVFEKLKTYYALLLKWQKAINLVSGSTMDQAWHRHFADSAQLAQYIPDHIKTISDLGSGAGFPGLVLAILRPDIDVHLVESDERKAEFLRTVSRETSVSCFVHNARAEALTEDILPDLITARALANLEQLCAYALQWADKNPDLQMLFLKGATLEEEIRQAKNTYKFEHDIYASATSQDGKIIRLKALNACV